MNVSQAIEKRRSTKAFDPDHKMSKETEDKLFSLAALTPSAFNLQHWRFVVVRDPALRQEIRKVAWDQAQITDASLLVILTADMKSWEKNARRVWESAPQETQDFMASAIHGYYAGKEQVQRDEIMRSCGLVGQTLMLAAQELGYDSCPMDGFDFDAVAKLINLPDDHVISYIVALGKESQAPYPKPPLLPLEELVITDRFE